MSVRRQFLLAGVVFAILLSGLTNKVQSAAFAASDTMYRPSYIAFSDRGDIKFYMNNRIPLWNAPSYWPPLSLIGSMALKAWWNTETTVSKSMEEINFNPGARLRWIRTGSFESTRIDNIVPSQVDFGFEHESTGDVKLPDASFGTVIDPVTHQPVTDFGSRGWNRWFFEFNWAHIIHHRNGTESTLSFYAKPWLRTNIEEMWMPNAAKYLGDAESILAWKEADWWFCNVIRWSGAMPGAYVSSESTFYLKITAYDIHPYLISQIWNGYGEHLRLYDRHKKLLFRLGIAFTNI